MKRYITLLVLLITSFVANATPIEQWSYNLKSARSQISPSFWTEQMMNTRNACINKAEMGEKLALKKISGNSLQNILKDILNSHASKSNENKMPWHLVLEMQRLARDTYREKYKSTNDVDDYVLALYHNCLSNGG